MEYQRKSQILCGITLILNLNLAYFAISAGFTNEFITLLGFGLFTISQLVWNCVSMIKLLRADPERFLKFEKWVTLITGIFTLQLALVIAIICFRKLSRQEGPGSISEGVVIGIATLASFLVVWKLKDLQSKKFNGQTILLDSIATFNTIKLVITVLVVSLIKYFAEDLWWIDNFGALFLAFQIGREGATSVGASRRSDYNPHP